MDMNMDNKLQELDNEIERYRDLIEQINKKKNELMSKSNIYDRIREIGLRKIEELLDENGEDGPIIDWDFCQLLGETAKAISEHYHKNCNNNYVWPYNATYDLKNAAKKLLNDTMERCISNAQNNEEGCKYDDCVSFYGSTATGRLSCSCHINIPNDIEEYDSIGPYPDYELIWFELTVEMDGICEY